MKKFKEKNVMYGVDPEILKQGVIGEAALEPFDNWRFLISKSKNIDSEMYVDIKLHDANDKIKAEVIYSNTAKGLSAEELKEALSLGYSKHETVGNSRGIGTKSLGAHCADSRSDYGFEVYTKKNGKLTYAKVSVIDERIVNEVEEIDELPACYRQDCQWIIIYPITDSNAFEFYKDSFTAEYISKNYIGWGKTVKVTKEDEFGNMYYNKTSGENPLLLNKCYSLIADTDYVDYVIIPDEIDFNKGKINSFKPGLTKNGEKMYLTVNDTKVKIRVRVFDDNCDDFVKKWRAEGKPTVEVHGPSDYPEISKDAFINIADFANADEHTLIVKHGKSGGAMMHNVRESGVRLYVNGRYNGKYCSMAELGGTSEAGDFKTHPTTNGLSYIVEVEYPNEEARFPSTHLKSGFETGKQTSADWTNVIASVLNPVYRAVKRKQVEKESRKNKDNAYNSHAIVNGITYVIEEKPIEGTSLRPDSLEKFKSNDDMIRCSEEKVHTTGINAAQTTNYMSLVLSEFENKYPDLKYHNDSCFIDGSWVNFPNIELSTCSFDKNCIKSFKSFKKLVKRAYAEHEEGCIAEGCEEKCFHIFITIKKDDDGHQVLLTFEIDEYEKYENELPFEVK